MLFVHLLSNRYKHETDEHYEASCPADSSFEPEEQRNEGCDYHDHIVDDCNACRSQRHHLRTQSENQCNVEDIGPDNIAESHLSVLLHSCSNRCCKFRKGCATSNKGKRNEGIVDSEGLCDLDCVINEHVAAGDKQGKSSHHLDY